MVADIFFEALPPPLNYFSAATALKLKSFDKTRSPVLNKNSSASLHLFDTVQCHWLVINVIIVIFIICYGVDFIKKFSSL